MSVSLALREEVRAALLDELRSILKEVQAVRARVEAMDAPSPGGDAYVSIERAAELVSVAPSTIRRWISTGQLHAHYAGRLRRIRVADLHACLARRDRDARAREPIDPERLAEAIWRRRAKTS